MKKLSTFLLLFNPLSTFGLIYLFVEFGYWGALGIPAVVLIVCLTTNFHDKMHADEYKAHEDWVKEYSKVNKYLGLDEDERQIWRNRYTGEITYH